MALITTVLSGFGRTAALAANNEATTETISIDEILYDANANRELINTVYFRNENGITTMSETPFEPEGTRAESNNIMTDSIGYHNAGIDNLD